MSTPSSFGFVRVSGADAANFLNGQFSHSTLNMGPGDGRLGAFCTPKGRAFASAFLLAVDEGFELWTLNATLPTLVASLRRYIMRAKVTFDDVPSVRDAAFTLPDGTQLDLGSAQIEAQTIAAGVPVIHAANAEAFVPQMINLDLLEGIDFAKGCYTGQEIVARTQNLGTIKRRMLPFACADTAGLVPGDKVTVAESAVGRIVSVGSDRVLASLRLASLNETLVAGEHNIPLGEQLTLPYAIPELSAET
ncbi:MAG: folate-binding protein YgfZ [Gammaproteobacteria bacterium]